jgi:D-alanine-D-alanine ligase
VAGEIERRGFIYTGTPPAVMRLTQNRMAVKETLRAAGLPTLPARVFTSPEQAGEWAVFPAIVKGANQHASVGIDRDSVVDDCDALARRIMHMRDAHADDSIVEPFLDSREFQVAVWGNANPEALPPSEILYTPFADMKDRLHTRAWKIERESRGYREILMPCPAPMDRPDWRARAEEIAVEAYRVIGLRDFARFDMRMLGDEPQILDVNANPELDPQSVVLAGARARGMTYGQMAGQIIQFAAERMPVS